jgi:putative nucleotidyltransferase with HDIG domain
MEQSRRAAFADGIVRMVALHDAETAIHLRATAALAGRIARHMRLDEITIEATELGALLHDIGKIAVGRGLLRKSADLSDEEWIEMRSHAHVGALALAGMPLLAHLAPIVRAHHERFDGHGYPDRLRDSEIPLEARIVAVADAFHALTTDRPYRRAILPRMALRVLECAAGPQFDVRVVTSTLELLTETPSSRRLSA